MIKRITVRSRQRFERGEVINGNRQAFETGYLDCLLDRGNIDR